MITHAYFYLPSFQNMNHNTMDLQTNIYYKVK